MAALATLSSSVLAEILFKGMMVYLRCSSPFSSNFLPVTFKRKVQVKGLVTDTAACEQRALNFWTKLLPRSQPTYLCVYYDVVEASSRDHLQCSRTRHVLDCDQVREQAFNFAAVPPSLWVPSERKQKQTFQKWPFCFGKKQFGNSNNLDELSLVIKAQVGEAGHKMIVGLSQLGDLSAQLPSLFQQALLLPICMQTQRLHVTRNYDTESNTFVIWKI